MSEFVHESLAAFGAKLRLMTVDEYYRAAERGVFGPDEKLELLEGVVFELSPQKSPHASATFRVRQAVEEAIPEAVVRDHSPLSLDARNEPEPDVLVAAGPIDRYDRRHPGPADVLLVVEVCDTSLRTDRQIKAPLYAAFGIPEYWILDLNAKRLEVYREPSASGYSQVETLDPTASIAPLAGNGQTIAVRSLLPI
ncbi:MAG TPA: Uma2 family endonuclease [Fimbriimonadaceae bacterium]|nr:Uma2 family endonuclease [Fimbriimonadaceae bacterium]